jgi:SWI/SNF-related matrix-associated actin-dependent regulator of chromatin subfamily A member 5
LWETGWKDWNKLDFNNFITACEKYGRNNFEQIAQTVGKSIVDIKCYGEVFLSRLD